MLSNDELRFIRKRDARWPTGSKQPTLAGADRRALLAHIDALTAAVEALRPPDRFVAMDGTWEQGVSEAAVLAILRGEE